MVKKNKCNNFVGCAIAEEVTKSKTEQNKAYLPVASAPKLRVDSVRLLLFNATLGLLARL